ncbi:cation transporter, partial [Oharaeibacter diazotrophicus]
MSASPTEAAAPIRVFDIDGMTCAACAGRIERVLAKTPGVREARVNLALERADVVLDPGVADDVVVAAVDRAGYGAEPRRADPAE